VNRGRSLALAAAAVLLAGCGSSPSAQSGIAGESGARILASARSAGERAATVHVAGSILNAGTPISLNMELVADKGGQGRLTQGDLEIELVGLNRAIYATGNTAFYDRFAGAGAAARLRGSWLRQTSPRGPLRSLAPLTDLPQLIDIALAGHGALSRGRPTSIDGHSAVAVTDLDRGGTLYVATAGIPYPLEIAEPGPHGGSLVFDGWNEPASISPPASVVDVDALQSGR
jgi:hypothetical protein